MKRITTFLLLWLCMISMQSFSQNPYAVKRPKLVVGIVVDQMRWDYLYRYADRYGKDGFNRLVHEGFSCENTMIPYLPAHTCAGHACVYTGSVPAIHGIIGNNWYDRAKPGDAYCADDADVYTVGSTSKAGKMSPRNLLTTTITDELRLATNFDGKVIGVALKDRAAIMPAGHMANAAYWFDNAVGGWISSSFYMADLPQWVKDLNAKKLADKYMAQDWKTLYPINTYKQSTEDDKPYESSMPGGGNTFPHQTSKLSEDKKYDAFRTTPYGNTYTADMAKAAIEGEKLGQRGVTDFLTVSFSSPDYIGHTFGPNSIEAEDCYLRLDRDLADLFKYLDAKIGKNQYLVFLTADHGAAHVPAFMREHHSHGGAVSSRDIKKVLNDEAAKHFGAKNLVTTVSNYQVYLNYATIDSVKIDKKIVTAFMIDQLLKLPYITDAVDLKSISSSSLPEPIKIRLINGYNAKLSGDIQFVFNPQWFDGGSKGTTHGMWNPYDSHIPLVWYGWNVKPGRLTRETYMTDIAPTVAAMLRIQMPNGTIGTPIPEVAN
ncbi:MAG: alkaline phosphatase family protein [Niabella sp.]